MPDVATGTADERPEIADVRIQDVTSTKEQTALEKLISSQPFWVAIALIAIIALMSWLQPEAFASSANVYNITRNFAFIGIMSIGMVCVIITGGIDLSVGSIMGLVGVVCGLLLQGGNDWWVALLGGLAAGMAAGLVNGLLVAYAGLSSFVVTLGMLSFARSVAIVLSENKMIYDFGPYGATFKALGGGSFLGLSNPVWALLILTLVFSIILKFTTWGRHLYSVGGNEHAARLTGVPVDRVKMQAYIVSSFTAAVAAILIVGWQGSAINALGTSYELRVIASTVIGGANLMGGEGGPIGAVIGAALLEVIRNSLLMQGIDSNWQGAFVGVFIVLAVLLEKIRGRRRA
ncbi:MAG TPA: ABC transporter permease [Bauldia sp.]|nr:ABC transporter permease [Bauldia sp.]